MRIITKMENNSSAKTVNLFNSAKIFWFNMPQQIRFVFAGGYNTVIGYLLFAAALFVLGQEHYQAALFISYILSSFNSYLSQKFLVFQTKGNYVKEYIKASTVWFLGYLFNAFILFLLTGKLQIYPYAAQAIGLICTTVLTYIMLKYYSFKSKQI